MNQVDQKKTVLLVDDAPSNIQVVNSILKDIYKIRIATNGAKALQLVKVAPPPRPDPARRHHAWNGWVRSLQAFENGLGNKRHTRHISYRTD